MPVNVTGSGKQTGVFEDVIDVFVNPSALFERARTSSFARPALIQTLLFAVLVLAVRNLVSPYFEAEFDRGMARAAAKGQEIPEGALAMSRKISHYTTVIGPIIAPWFVALFGGLATWIGARVVGARLSFGQSATIAAWSYTPAALGFLAMAVQGALSDTSAVRGVSDASLGLSRFLDPATASPALLALLNNLDIFGIWSLVLTAIGISVVARTTRGTGGIAALIRFAIGALVTVLPAALRG